jgi:predicted nucleic acid-binding protein
MDNFDFAVIRKQDIKTAITIKQRYRYSYWDSLIIASALEANCSILYTEDMHNGQIIEKRLKILNPFIND